MLHSIDYSILSRRIGLIAGPVAFTIFAFFAEFDPDHPELSRMTAIAVLMAIWWITEAVPLAITALLPMVLYPLLGIMKAGTIAPVYFNSTIFLFLGGFLIALAMEKTGLHKRIALTVLRLVGGSSPRIILAFMAVTAFLSMWISNTATVVMMLPVALSVVYQAEETATKSEAAPFTTSLLLGIAYASSVGGMATLVGTPPNLSFSRIYQIMCPEADPIAFGSWFIMALPISLTMLAGIWLLLTQFFFRVPSSVQLSTKHLDTDFQKLGTVTLGQKWVFAVFASAAFLWVFRKPLTIGELHIPGWADLFTYGHLMDDSTVAIFLAILLFLLPGKRTTRGFSPILKGDAVKKLPWHIILLFGGGFALAKGFQETGLAAFVGEQFAAWAGTSEVWITLGVCTGMTFLTELTSNTATTEMVLPILASVGETLQVNPLVLMVPATLSASCAFMMPVATPPNAIVFGSQRVSIRDMVRVGFWINLFGIVTILSGFLLFGQVLLSG